MRGRVVWLGVLLLAVPHSATADSEAVLAYRLAACAREPLTNVRLACFENLARVTAARTELQNALDAARAAAVQTSAPPTTAAQRRTAAFDNSGRIVSIGHWLVSRAVDPMTDQANVVLTLGGTTANAMPGVTPSLTIACTTQRLSIFVTAPTLLSRDAAPVRTQTQQPTQAQTQTRPRPQTEVQPANQTPGIPVRLRFDQREPVQQVWSPSPQRNVAFAPDMRGFVERLLQSQRLLLEVTTRAGQPHLILFEVTGAEAVLPELQSCFRTATAAPATATVR